MKTRSFIVSVLTVFCVILSIGTKENASAQQGDEHGPGLERLFNLASYQGLEDTPYFGDAPTVTEYSLLTPDIEVPYSQIVFQSYQNEEDWNIYLADGSAGNQTQLTSGASEDIHPRLNRGCTKIVFASNTTGSYEIYTMNPDGSGITRLTHNNQKDDVYPAWSYDGTLIVFQSYRDGNPEIYTMYPDGTNQVRLTSYSGFDGTPAWSVDGRIVFASGRVGPGGIWVMNSDGSGLTQLSNQPFSYYPAWSPDSSQIAYSSDVDGNGFLELWLMNSDGSNPHILYNSGLFSDDWARSWSPGGQYIAFTYVNWVYNHGELMWTLGYLYVWDTEENHASWIINDTEWHPDWQTIDTLLPTSSMSALPAISPASFLVSWSGYDEGPSGLKNFDVQVKDGVSGNWIDWMVKTTSTSAIYTGIGSHTYYFRTRAHDVAGNFEAWPMDYDAVTIVEALPPYTFASHLPPYIHSGRMIKWGGIDPGGSGIKTYDVQYRDIADGIWINWFTNTTDTDADFSGTSGHTYQFRVRATDKAQNVEDWPSGDGDTFTTIYKWAIKGYSLDNTGVPLAGMEIFTLPEAHEQAPSDINGNYATYVVNSSGSYTVTWDKDGYGDLPTTTYGISTDAEVDIVMPPSNNLVKDWGFEDRSFGTTWIPTGGITPTLSEKQHTGQYSAQLSQPYHSLPAEPISLTTMSDSRSNMAIGTDSSVHIVWGETEGDTSHVFYAFRNADGDWPVLHQDISGPNGGASPQIAVDDNLIAHVVWSTNEEIYYSSKSSGGDWSNPENLTNNAEIDSEALIRVGSDGVIHVLWWQGDRNTEYDLGYAQKDSGSWSNTIVIHLGEHLNEGRLHFISGEDGKIYVQYSGTECHYTQREPDGTWASLEIFPKTQGCGMHSDVLMAVDTYGGVHAVWQYNWAGVDYYFYYAKRDAGGWSEPETIIDSKSSDLALTVDPGGTPHVTWCQTDTYFYSRRRSENSWRSPESIPGRSCNNIKGNSFNYLLFDHQSTLHLAWASGGVHYMYRQAGEDWSTPWEYTTGNDTVFDLAIEDHRTVHMLWNNPWQVFYAGPPSAEQTGESTISQVIHVPITLTTPTLSFMYNLDGWSTSGLSRFSVRINDGTATAELFSPYEPTFSWQHTWFNLTPWSNKTITLTFQVDQTAGYYPVWAYLDEITVGSAHPDSWVSGFIGEAALPGKQVTFKLYYGNRSPAVDTINATITATLPTGIIFQSANPTPMVNGNILTWSVGDLPAVSGQFTILVTTTVAGNAVLGSYLTIPVEITASTPELELVNNQIEFVLYIGSRIYLPVIVQ